MSTLDIDKLVASLISSKIKERNDALSLLETISISKFKLSSDQFKILTQAILKLIEHESRVYYNNKSSPVESRLSLSSYYLRLLTEKSIEDTSKTLRNRIYIDLCNGIMEHFFIESGIQLEPCSIDFMKTISAILNVGYVKEHLNKKSWVTIYNFLLDIIEQSIISDADSLSLSRSNEMLFVETYNALQYLLQCDKDISVNYIEIYEDNNYFRLLSALDKTIQVLKKENIAVIMVFRIINKLIITISTVNFRFVNKMIKLGIQLMIFFNGTQWGKLHEQFLIFINLPATHKLIHLHHLPKLIGEGFIPGDILDPGLLDQEDEEESIKSQVEQGDMNKEEVLLYHIRILLQNLIKRASTSDFELKPNQIGIYLPAKSVQLNHDDWFQFKSVYLKSEDSKSWMLISGITKLLDTYFEFKSILQETSSDPNSSLFGNSMFIGNSRNKRQKLETIGDALNHSRNITEFCNRLIHSKNSTEHQILGLKIITFRLEMQKIVYNPQYNKSSQLTESTTSTEVTKTFINSNTTLDILLSNSDEGDFNRNVIFKNILGTFDNVKLNFWSLLASRAIILEEIWTESDTRTLPQYVGQILKLCFLLIKQQQTVAMACNLIFLIVFQQSNKLNELVDDSLLIQLGSLIDLAEISGPCSISEESFQYWFAIYKLSIDVNLPKKDILAVRIQDWLLSKWEGTLQNQDLDILFYSNIAEFVYWLAGNQCDYRIINYLHQLYNGSNKEVFYFTQTFRELESWLFLEPVYSTPHIIFDYNMVSLPGSISLNQIFEKVTETFKLYNSSDVSNKRYLQWLAITQRISDKFKLMDSFCSSTDGLDYHLQMGIAYFRQQNISAGECLDLIEVIVPEDLECFEMFVKAGIFEKLVNSFKSEIYSRTTSKHKVNANQTQEDGFEREFSAVRDANTPSTPASNEKMVNLLQLKYMKPHSLKVLERLGSCYKTPEELIKALVKYLEYLEGVDLLLAVLYCVKSVVPICTTISTFSKFITTIGEKLLGNQHSERNELVLTSILDLMSYVVENNQAEKQCNDISKWLIQCGERELILTESSVIAYCDLLVKQYKHMEPAKSELFHQFAKATNNVKVNLADNITVGTISGSQEDDQEIVSLYNKLFETFPDPQQSVETAGTYALFFTRLSLKSSSLFYCSIFNLLQCSRFSFFMPYLEACLQTICQQRQMKGPLELFKTAKLDILCYWWKLDDIERFPFNLFDYPDLQTFYRENYRELSAVSISTSRNITAKSNADFIENLASLKNTDSATLVSESLSLIVSVAYSSQGIRNEVFDIIQQYFQGSFKQEFKDKLSMIVLEIIKFTEIPDNKEFTDYFRGNELASIFESSFTKVDQGSVVISFKSSLELIKKLVVKYHGSANDFWNVKQVYFLIRRVSTILSVIQNPDQIKIALTKISLILVLGGYGSIDLYVTRLLVSIIRNLPVECFDYKPFVSSILVCFHDLFHHKYEQEESLPLVIQILELSFSYADIDKDLVRYIEVYTRDFEGMNSIRQFLDGIVEIYKQNDTCPKLLHSSMLESCLETLDFCQKDASVFIRLISHIFPYVGIFDHAGDRLPVVENLLRIDQAELKYFNKDFKIWIADYLSQFYLGGGALQEIKVLDKDEYNGIKGEEFEKEVSFFDFIFDKIIDQISGSDFDSAACAESILGVLIMKFQHNNKEFEKFLNFKEIYKTYKDQILSIDFHTCALLNDELDVDYLGDSLSDIIENLESFLEADLELWTTRLYLVLLQELAPYTSIAPLLSTFVIKVKSFAKESLAELICYYLVLKGKPGEKTIISILNAFVNSHNSKRSVARIFLKIITTIRIGAYKNLDKFLDVFEKVDVLSFYKLAVKNKHFRTAMMLFEDAVTLEQPGATLEDEYPSLRTVYESLDDDDLIYGLPEKPSLEYAISLEHRHGYSAELLQYSSAGFDSDITLTGKSTNYNIVESLSENGLLGVSRLINRSTGSIINCAEPFEWSWKLSQWDLPVTGTATKENEVIYKTLKQIHDYSINANDCQNMVLNVLENKLPSSESNLSIKEYRTQIIRWMKTMSEISTISSIVNYQDGKFSKFVKSYNQRTRWFEDSDLEMSENIMLARRTAFQLLSTKLKKPRSELTSNYDLSKIHLSEDEIWLGSLNDLVRYNNLTRQAGESQKMVTSTMLIDGISKSKFDNAEHSLRLNVSNLCMYQTAQMLWTQGNSSVPVLMMKELYDRGGVDIKEVGISIDKCLIRAKMVSWMSESRQELSSNIMEKHVMPVANMALSMADIQQAAKVFQLFAHFCEAQYKSKSLNEAISKLEKRVANKQKEINELKDHYGKTAVPDSEKKTVQKFYSKLKMSFNSESMDLKSLVQSRDLFSTKAVEYYLESIIVGDDVEEDLDKFFALWLEQSSNETLNSRIKASILSLPSFKLINWCIQLISRLTKDATEFQSILQELIINMCVDHPHHSLYLLISLRKHKQTAETTSNPLLLSKCSAADIIWDELLHKDDHVIENLLLPIEKFSDECVKLAAYKANKGKTLNLEKLNVGSYWLKQLPSIPPPTKFLKVDQTKAYNNVPVLVSVEHKLTIASSGLSLPKIATFNLSDGTQHKILLKHGTDDLRQDSIMEQVFNKVNNIFAQDRECKKRKLRIRTYNVVPLGPQSGIIEFVPNTTALIDIIKPYHDAHDRIKYEKAREIMKACQSKDKSERLREYERITVGLEPVLRYFFQGTFLNPDAWFSSRIKYTHGVATSSIVGYVLGLGDRHCNNILLDKNSGEPVHIDLGVAFDQGKRLPVPETVPFRLTRDIVDGFGVTGVEGVFKKSCEHTLRVLRSNRDHIISILDVLRWDPLYSWTLSPLRKKRLQDDDTNVGFQPEEDGSEAGRAVQVVADKLTAGGLSIEASVRELVQEATNPQNLALIYFGWCPFF
ncbi:uncharacterized protein SPAPADRAFT_153174 [Spathaspora passalidarum NRRL Y-27907]|uniref:Serine/threonine-protein kinase Tel1 n=1 Tax=Spathaspora passalidarum (strain NRRL Y-27907 / 11-Y1) TaxID=619300 RepID=G3AMU1_SPAPN|nr:uncharacterized protein SPAPADRAFT_153174 [Spathaspora passalidarum NRRL Y-27907]EGW32355.1 hypothetical protein SPAPADRAFT_153174 [Spathaspora passalidarum NRRL Y-27907]